jgi:CheY-like chemotaxis protein
METKCSTPNNEHPVAKHRILLVDDNDDIRAVFQEGLESRGFEVVPAATANRALTLISTEKFDVLLTDLHMPDAGDGLTVVSAMRHAHPHAITLVQSGYPAMQEAATTILLQADEILAKPIGLARVAEIIREKLSNPKDRMALNKDRVATILQRDMDTTIEDWMNRVTNNSELSILALPPPRSYRASSSALERPHPSPAPATYFQGSRFKRRTRARGSAAQARLHGWDGRRRVSNPSG